MARFRHDPQGFLDGVRLPAILDEIQNVPEVFNFIRGRIDHAPRRMGQWFLTGSQETGLMQRVTESMAGRAAVLQLYPMSVRETPKVGLLRGGYPEVLARPARPRSGSVRTFRPIWSATSAPSARCTISPRFAASSPCWPGGGVRLIEVKASSTVMPVMAGPMQRLAAAWRKRAGGRGAIEMVIVHWPTRTGTSSTALAPGVKALPWQQFAANPLLTP